MLGKWGRVLFYEMSRQICTLLSLMLSHPCTYKPQSVRARVVCQDHLRAIRRTRGSGC